MQSGVVAQSANVLALPIFLLLVLFVTFTAVLPSLRDGLSRDDFIHRIELLGRPLLPNEDPTSAPGLIEAANSLFSFFNEEKNHKLAIGLQSGWIPWWTSPQLKVDFWRPVAAISHWIDYRAWPENLALHHLHSILWYLMLVCAVFVFFWNLKLPPIAIGIATAMYALDASHYDAIAWLANRNILISSVFGITGLNFLLSSLEAPRHRIRQSIALTFLVLSLLSAEGGISILPFMLLAVLMFNNDTGCRNDTSHKPIRVVLLILAIFLTWQLTYTLNGHGARFSGVYIHPVGEFHQFLNNGMMQWPILFMDQVTGLESLQSVLSDQALKIQTAIAYGFLIVFFALISPLLRYSRVALFLLLAGLAALVPAGTTVLTGGRLMFFSGVAICGVVGLFAYGLLTDESWVPKSRTYRIVGKMIVGCITLIQIASNGYIWYAQGVAKLSKSEQIQLSKYTDISKLHYSNESTVVYVNPPVTFDMMYVPAKLDLLGKVVPGNIAQLIPGIKSVTVRRSKDNAVVVTCPPPGCPISAEAPVESQKPVALSNGMQRLDSFFSDATASIPKEIKLDHFAARIIESYPAGLPKSIEFDFQHPLDDRSLVWAIWDNTHQEIRTWQPPSIGDQQDIQGYSD